MEDKMALVLDNVSVRYRKNNSNATADIVKKLLGKASSNDFWALKNVSFSLEKGEMLGVIGRNGAGKSTLMKAISGTLFPASGEIQRNGKICALLELGTGFDRDMTVKENVYLRGALLGYTKDFIDSKYEEIIDYADMREFEDNPFRTLSSGMKSRIAFAIVSMIEPEIIILDEVFAVGDGDFRKKSQETMERILSKGNTTALIVSHSIKTVKEQCSKVLWLNRGKMVMMGEPETVCAAYEEFLKTKKLPDTEDVRRGELPSKNKLKKTKKRRIAELCGYLALFFTVCAGIFLWSQHDVIAAYKTSKELTAETIVAEYEQKTEDICELLGISDSDWDETLLSELAQEVKSEKLTQRNAAALFAERQGIAESDKLALYYAEMRIISELYTDRLDELISELRLEYEALPRDERPDFLRYCYGGSFGDFFSLEGDYEDDIQNIIEKIRPELVRSGEPEAIADRVATLYKEQKNLRIAEYMANMERDI